MGTGCRNRCPFEQVEILVNGEVVWKEGPRQAGIDRPIAASVTAPAGGWVAARVHGGTTAWPAMDSYPFAHTAPLWFGPAGSTDPGAAARAAKDLLAALDVAEGRIEQSYEGPTLPNSSDESSERGRSLRRSFNSRLPNSHLPRSRSDSNLGVGSWELEVGSWPFTIRSIPMFSPPSGAIRDLPAPVAQVLGELVERAAASLGDTLRSVVLFGSAAENRLRPTSDVNVLVVVTRFEPARVEPLTAVLQRGHAAVRLAVMWLLEEEIAWASESFAVKFADIARRRRILFGSDPFTGLTISRHAAIIRVRQVLLNLMMRLRASYARDAGHDERLAILLADAAGPLRASAAEILELQGRPAPTAREALEILAAEWSPTRGAAVVQSIRTARETRRLEPGTPRSAMLDVIDLAGNFSGRAFELT